MRFPRNARIFRGQLDFAPLAGVFFLLVLFLLLSRLIYTPGVSIELPTVTPLRGTLTPHLAIAVDARGQMYFDNQQIDETQLRLRLSEAVKRVQEPVRLLLQADKSVTCEKLLRVAALAQDAGIRETLVATRSQNYRLSPKPPVVTK